MILGIRLFSLRGIRPGFNVHSKARFFKSKASQVVLGIRTCIVLELDCAASKLFVLVDKVLDLEVFVFRYGNQSDGCHFFSSIKIEIRNKTQP